MNRFDPLREVGWVDYCLFRDCLQKLMSIKGLRNLYEIRDEMM